MSLVDSLTTIQISNPADKEKIKKATQEADIILSKIQALRESLSDLSKAIAEEHQIPKKIVNKMFRTYHKQNYIEQTKENEDFELMYENIIEANNND